MWRDICVANRDRAAATSFDVLRSESSSAMRKLLEAGDAPALEKLFAEARAARERWLQASRAEA